MRFPTLTPRRLIGLAATAVCTAALVPVAALAATASPAAPAAGARAAASAQSIPVPTISVDSVTVVANGAVIRVVFTASCVAGRTTGTISSTITEAAGNHIAQGTTLPFGFTCTGKPQQVSGLAPADVNGVPFRPGIAFVQASALYCPGANCSNASTDKILSIQG